MRVLLDHYRFQRYGVNTLAGLALHTIVQVWWWSYALQLSVTGTMGLFNPAAAADTAFLFGGSAVVFITGAIIMPFSGPVFRRFLFPLLLMFPAVYNYFVDLQLLHIVNSLTGWDGGHPLPVWAAAGTGVLLAGAMRPAGEALLSGRFGLLHLFAKFFVRLMQFWILIPLLWLFAAAFWIAPDGGGLWESLWQVTARFTLSHFEQLLTGSFPVWLLNSLLWAAGVTLLCMVPAVAGGYLLSRIRFWGRRQLLVGSNSLQLLPGVLLLPVLSWSAFRIGFFEQWQALYLIYPVFILPFMLWMLKGMFDAVPREVEYAAVLDGVSPVGRVWHVLLPQMRTGLLVVFSYGFMAVWGEFAAAKYCLNGDPARWTLPLGLQSVLQDGKIGQFAAGSLLGSLPVVIIFVYLHRQMIQTLSGDMESSGGVSIRWKLRRRYKAE